MVVAWSVLLVSGMCEVLWAYALAHRSMRLPARAVLFVVGSVLSLGGLWVALQSIPVGVGYAVWIGMGAVTTVVVSMLRGLERPTLTRLVFLGLIVSGVVGLQVVSR